MKTYLVVLILSAITSFLMTPWARSLAFKIGAVDLPNSRKVHTGAMPRLGGVAVIIGFLACWIGFYLVDNRISEAFQNYEKRLLGLLFGTLVMLALGIYDDIKGANARKKFAVQILAGLLLIFSGIRIETLSNPFGSPLHLGVWSTPITLLWIVGVTNAINLLDGIDGLATGVAACISLTLGVFSIFMDNILLAILSLSLTGACLGFLPHNYFPARIFLGDSGSLVIGFVLSAIGIMSVFKAPTAVALAVPLLIFALPIFDTGSVVIGRLLRGDSVFEADRSHVHHRLLELGWTHKKAAGFLYILTGVLAVCALGVSLIRSVQFTLIVSVMVMLLAISLIIAWRRSNRGRLDDK